MTKLKAMTQTNKYTRIIEVGSSEENTRVTLPIVKFPPFKLRAAMVEKDPVIWLHLLEVYVSYLQHLMSNDRVNQLSDSTYEGLCAFIKSYLHELAEEEGKLLSLGMNADVLEQLRLLRYWVLALIKKCGLLYLQIFSESVWDLIKLYVHSNLETVRSLVDGSLKPDINTNQASLNRTYMVQAHIKQLVETRKFSRVDLKAFESLLSGKPVTRKRQKESFAEQFFTTKWLEQLEKWYDKGSGNFSEISQKLGIISCLSVSVSKIASLFTDLGVNNLESLALYPLLGSICINESFKRRVPGLEKRLLFLNFVNGGEPPVNADDIAAIGEVFPHLSKYQIEQLYKKHDYNAEITTNALFEDPASADGIPREEPTTAQSETKVQDDVKTTSKMPFRSTDRITRKEEFITSEHVPDELRNTTLTRALKLLYQGDEDERDDTYDDAEIAQPPTSGRVELEADLSSETNTQKLVSKYDQIEGYLWELLKKDTSLFEKSVRKSKIRNEMKQSTGWSDEQIEGWARMLERSPQRARILEEKYVFKGNVRSGKTSYVKNKDVPKDNNVPEVFTKRSSGSGKQVNKSETQTPGNKKKQFARNEKNKGSRANHNRKAGHDKKMSKAAA